MPKASESLSIAKPLLVMLALMVAISATAVQFYRHYDRETRENAQDLVTAVAQLQAKTVEIWLDGRGVHIPSLSSAPSGGAG
jgi:CHASE3 domain sensor protein